MGLPPLGCIAICMSTRCICVVALQVKTVASNPFLDLTAWRRLSGLQQLTLEVCVCWVCVCWGCVWQQQDSKHLPVIANC